MSANAQVKIPRGRRGHPAGLILFAMGAARVPPEPPLPGPALIALLGELGLSEPAARAAILRMRRGGWLASRRTGRTVSYAPSASTLAGYRRRENAFAELDRPGDGGGFHALLVSVPERNRAFRDELRRAAHIAGYRTLRAGLLVAPSDRRPELGDLLDRVPPEASVVAGRLQLAPADARRVAGELWALPELADRYRAVAASARAATAAALVDRPAGADAFGALAAALLPVYEAIADDPGLPAELLPPAWPAGEVGAALAAALSALGPPVSAHIDELRRRARAGRG